MLITYAAYTEVSSIKRVVSTQMSPGQMFSSNCMRHSITNLRLSSSEYTLTVCNYDQDKPGVYNSFDITYTLHAKIVVRINDVYYDMTTLKSHVEENVYEGYVSKAANYHIYKTYDDLNPSVLLVSNPVLAGEKKGFNETNNFTVDFSSDTLKASRSSVDRYKVEIDSSSISDENTNIFVHVWAEPSSPTGLTDIQTRLYGAAATASTSTWTGNLLETDCETVDYDFYNYIITGSGSGTVTVTWDSTKFEINPFFIAELTSYENVTNNNWVGIRFPVDSTVKNRYELQLYKNEPNVSYIGNENKASNFINLSFSE